MSKTHLNCSKCGVNPRKKTYSWCQPCVNAYEKERWAKTDLKARRDKHLKSRYGIDYSWFLQQLKGQDGKCLLCLTDMTLEGHSSTKVCVDHDHKTGKVRGLLCNHCNRALGLFRDDAATVSRALAYLRKE